MVDLKAHGHPNNSTQQRQVDGISPACRLSFLGTEINNVTLDQFLAEFNQGFIVTPNVNHVLLLRRDRQFRAAYDGADYQLCDSQILRYAAQILGTPIREKISGSDFFPAFYRYHADNPEVRIFLLGAEEGVGAIAQQKINQKVNRKMVVDTYSPPFGFEHNDQEGEYICERIRQSGATVLVLGLGAPKQEKWFHLYRDRMPNTLKMIFALGCVIDLEAGNKPRSPQLLNAIGLEWLVRMLREPKRLGRRYVLDMVPFVQMIGQEFWRRRVTRT